MQSCDLRLTPAKFELQAADIDNGAYKHDIASRLVKLDGVVTLRCNSIRQCPSVQPGLGVQNSSAALLGVTVHSKRCKSLLARFSGAVPAQSFRGTNLCYQSRLEPWFNH